MLWPLSHAFKAICISDPLICMRRKKFKIERPRGLVSNMKSNDRLACFARVLYFIISFITSEDNGLNGRMEETV